MGKKKKVKAKVKRKPRKTIASTVLAILSRAHVGTDASIVAEVKAAHAGTKFNEKHLAWYKSKFRVGGLKGQSGKRHAINQKVARKPKVKATRLKGKKKGGRRKPKMRV